MKSSVFVYWIDKKYMFQSSVISSSQLKGGTTFEHEAGYITGDAEHMEVILCDRAGNAEERARVERLKKKAEELRLQTPAISKPQR